MKKKPTKLVNLALIIGFSFYLIVAGNNPAYAMHIGEGFLPLKWVIFWWMIALPFVIFGFKNLTKITKENPELKLLIALAGAFGFVLSALKIPSVTGSCSHPTGTGLGTVLFGPSLMAPLGSLVLIFQAILLAHGGLTTLGANIFSMAIVGPWVAFGVYLIFKKIGREKVGIFLAATLGDLATYVVTSIQLALAFPSASGGFLASFLKFSSIFAITQIPLAISEGFLTLLVWNWLTSYAQDELKTLKLLQAK